MQRHLEDKYKVNGKIIKNIWIRPGVNPTKQDIRLLMATLLEISVSFFFDNFIYTFVGQRYLTMWGGDDCGPPNNMSESPQYARLV